MPSVYLSDEELIEMVLDRPEILTAAIQKMAAELEKEQSSGWQQFSIIMDLRKQIRELKGETK